MVSGGDCYYHYEIEDIMGRGLERRKAKRVRGEGYGAG